MIESTDDESARRRYQEDGRYSQAGSKSERTSILSDLMELAGWHHDHARKDLEVVGMNFPGSNEDSQAVISTNEVSRDFP